MVGYFSENPAAAYFMSLFLGSATFVASSVALTDYFDKDKRNSDDMNYLVSGSAAVLSTAMFVARPQLLDDFLREERFYNGMIALVGSVGHWLYSDKALKASAMTKLALGGFLVGFGFPVAITPGAIRKFWDGRRDTALDVVQSTINVTVVGGGVALITTPRKEVKQGFGITLLAMSGFYALPQSLRDFLFR